MSRLILRAAAIYVLVVLTGLHGRNRKKPRTHHDGASLSQDQGKTEQVVRDADVADSDTDPPAQDPPATPGNQRPRLDDFTRNRPHPDAAQMIRDAGWPRNDNGNISARGVFFDSNGQQLTDTVQAGRGPADNATDLREPWATGDVTTRWHIEGHVAAMMRNGQMTDGVLYLNIPPCGRDGDPTRCDTNIPAILPQGSRLTVWVVQEGGGFRRRDFEGTGEGLL